MAEDSNQRYATVGEVSSDIEHFLDGLPVTAYPEGPLRRSWRWILRNRAWLLLLLVYGCGAGASDLFSSALKTFRNPWKRRSAEISQEGL